MDFLGISKYIEVWLANYEAGRANSMSLKIQKVTDQYLEIFIDGKVLQLTMPTNFNTSFSADGIISNPNCAFVATLAKGKLDESNMDTAPKIVTALNEKLDRLSSRGSYDISSVLDLIVDTFEKFKYCSDCEGEIEEEEEDEEIGGISDSERYLGATGTVSSPPNRYFNQLIEDASKKCDEARSLVMSARAEVPDIGSLGGAMSARAEVPDILRWCKVYSSSRRNWCAGFEIELSGILSEGYRHRHGHLFEALGFSFATPLLIEVMFEPLGSDFTSASLQAQGESLGGAFRGLSATQCQIKRKFVSGDGDPTGQDDPDEQIAKVIDNPTHLYGLRSLLPQMAKDFFSHVLLSCEDNIFVRFLLFTASRLASLLKRCIVCSRELPFTVSKLSSCANELCLFSFEVLGLGAQVLQEVIRMPLELVDLEISLALAAAGGSRNVFEPFPPFLLEEREIRQRSQLLNNEDNQNPRHNIAKPSQRNSNSCEQSPNNKNMDVLKSIIKSFPPVSEMRLCADEVKLKAKLAEIWLSTPEGKLVEKSGDEYIGKEVWQLPYNVLRFILCTNRMSLVFLSDNDDKVLKVNNSLLYQFAVVRDSPEREAAYTESYRNQEKVSRFGFHGSRRENWYSILRNGVRCFSSTKLMSSGNSLGDGIYLADNLHYSAGYATSSTAYAVPWMNGMFMDGFYVVSICEVISPTKVKEGSGIWAVPKEHEGSVAVRYLLVYASHDKRLSAGISDGHILSYLGDRVNLFEHYQNIREKFVAGSCS